MKRFLNPNTIIISYEDLLNTYINIEILQLQFNCDFFLENCLSSNLDECNQDILLGEYFNYLRTLKFNQERIAKDLIFLLKFLALNKKRGFVESLVNINLSSRLNSCYCYDYTQIQANFEFFGFCLNLLGCASIETEAVFLHHTEQDIHITNPKKFFNFLFKFMSKSIAYGLNIARTEVIFAYSLFLYNCNNSPEDAFSKIFMTKCLDCFIIAKPSFRCYYDKEKFHL